MSAQPPPPPPPPPAAAAAGGPVPVATTSTNPPPLRPPAAQPPFTQQHPSSSSSQNAGPHLLSLKVMRASAPSLAISEKPYYDSHPSSSSISNPLIAAVGKGIAESIALDPLSNYFPSSSSSTTSPASAFPVSSLLTLPSSFGTLFLGETFRTYLCVRNESPHPVREPSLRVEMQVGSSETEGRWHQLSHLILPAPTGEEDGKSVWELPPSSALETSLGYDIKDLGPHVLVCTVGYKARMGEGGGWVERNFRKFYKFSVDRSPISVRTKVHQPRHAASVYHAEREVRERVELEVQVQNVSGGGSGLVFTGLMLRPAEGWGWSSVDRPSFTAEREGDMWVKPNKGGEEILNDGDIRQYLFTLTPKQGASLGQGLDLGTTAEGYAIKGEALGNLDISWRMSLGEQGRLQTSQLVIRRVVFPPIDVASLGSGAGSVGAKVRAEVRLLPSAMEVLRGVKAGSEVELGVKVLLRDVSGLDFPLPPVKESRRIEEREEKEDEEDDDDDKPLSQIASSPRTSRRNTISLSTDTDDDLEKVTIKRKFKLALQHCSILPPSPLPLPPPAQPSAFSVEEGGPSTPRKPSSTPLRTSTPTQTAALDKAKSRFQANLSNLVRGGSLSLRPGSGRGSVEVGLDGVSTPAAGLSRVGTPLPPAVPPKTPTLPAAANVPEAGASEKEMVKEIPEPTLSWSRIQDLYAIWSESNAQAITRPTNSAVFVVPESFLPASELASFEGGSLIILPHMEVEGRVWKSKSTNTIYRFESSTGKEGEVEEVGEVEGVLRYAISNDVQESVVRFGALRVLLLAYTEEGAEGEEEREVECNMSLLEVPVFAEAVIGA